MTDENRSILMGGLVVGILSSSYLGIINMLCCLGVMLGAAVGVWHYTSEQRTTLESGEGARLGAAAAVVGLLVSLIVNFVLTKIGLGADQALSGLMQSSLSDMMDDQQLELMRQQMEEARNRSFFETVFNFNTLISLVIFPLFGAAGGAAGASLFQYGDDGPGGGGPGGGPRHGGSGDGGPTEREAEYEILEE